MTSINFAKWRHELEQVDRNGKRPGKQNGPIGAVGFEVADWIVASCGPDEKARLPTVDLAKRLHRSRSATEEAVARLVRAGFIDYVPSARGRAASYRPKWPGI